MCGRYVLSMRPGVVRQRLADQNMPTEEAPDDDAVRQSYNFAPGYHGLIYRADTSDHGASNGNHDKESIGNGRSVVDGLATKETKYKLQAARWGLIPFWTKRAPDYASQMRTINCRDDSLIENRGMWNTMKQRKRCLVLAEGFYEWLKKGKEKIPYLTKRRDGQLMCFAGLWDMVQYEDSTEKLYTYTVITTDSSKQLKFLHDRMPVILEPGSDEMKTWLDPNRIGWDKKLQSMLKPYERELECYPVDKAVGKVGNNSSSFLIPIDSKENKQNIANFFGTQRATARDVTAHNEAARNAKDTGGESAVKHVPDEHRETATKIESTEDNAPLPKPESVSERGLSQRLKQDTEDLGDDALIKTEEQTTMEIDLDVANVDDETLVEAADEMVERGIKREMSELDDASLLAASDRPPRSKAAKIENTCASPKKSPPMKKSTSRRSRNATCNDKVAKTPTKGGNAKITSFFGK